MAWQRARNPEQKEQRRTAILEATAKLFEEEGLDGVSLNAIANEAGISKGNIYRYFESREEIFLHLLLEYYGQWVVTLERALAPLAGSDDVERVARAMTASYAAHPRFASLVAVTASVLEKNVTADAVVSFKTQLLDVVIRVANAIHASLPALDMERTQQFIMYAHLLMSAMWPAANPPAAVRSALLLPELQFACVDFDRDAVGAVTTLLRGLLAQ
jgi:AcrR family transcriptional regulator